MQRSLCFRGLHPFLYVTYFSHIGRRIAECFNADRTQIYLQNHGYDLYSIAICKVFRYCL